MKPDEITLPNIIAKIKTIALKDYDGKLYDNLLPIFYQLEKDERELFLRALYNIVILIENYPVTNKLECAHTNSLPDSLKKEIKKIEDDEFNKRELVKLKTWLTKALAVILLLGFSVTIGLTIGLGDLAVKILDIIDGTFKVFKVLFSI